MKMRTDFVSNSSSSSFVLLGKTMSFEDFIDSVSNAGCDAAGQESESEMEVLDIEDWISRKTKGFILFNGNGEDYEFDEVALGADPSLMKNNETLKDFKKKVVDKLKSVGIKAKLSEIRFVPCGNDTSRGLSWIECYG